MESNVPTRKFMFDRSFDDATVVHRAERKPVLMKPEQIDALRQEGFDAGFEAGQKRRQDQQDEQINQLLGHIDQNIDGLMQNLAALAAAQERETKQLSLAIAKKLLPDFAARNGLGEIEALLTETIRDMAREPRLVVRVHEAQFDSINERVQAIAQQRAYAGKVIVLGDHDVASGDCRVEWADGGIERNAHTTWQAVETAMLPT